MSDASRVAQSISAGKRPDWDTVRAARSATSTTGFLTLASAKESAITVQPRSSPPPLCSPTSSASVGMMPQPPSPDIAACFADAFAAPVAAPATPASISGLGRPSPATPAAIAGRGGGGIASNFAPATPAALTSRSVIRAAPQTPAALRAPVPQASNAPQTPAMLRGPAASPFTPAVISSFTAVAAAKTPKAASPDKSEPKADQTAPKAEEGTAVAAATAPRAESSSAPKEPETRKPQVAAATSVNQQPAAQQKRDAAPVVSRFSAKRRKKAPVEEEAQAVKAPEPEVARDDVSTIRLGMSFSEWGELKKRQVVNAGFA